MRDLRRYAHQTNFRLAIGFVLLLLFVGIGLIYIFFGSGAAVMGLICLVSGLFPLLLIALSLWLIGEFVKKHHED